MTKPFNKLFGFCVLLFLLFLHNPLQAQSVQKYTISGYVSDSESGEKLIAATVFDKKSGAGTVTNTYGFFSLTLPTKDSIYLTVTYLGFQAQIFPLLLKENKQLKIDLLPTAALKEVTITAEKYEKIEERAQMSRIDIPIEQIKNIPALLGEKDVLKALQLLPGVSSGGEGQSGLYVRGGGADQNLILLDGVPVYNASHLFGFFSVFNADAIKDVTLTKGGFPARYGGRLSSVVEINLKEGNENEFHGEGSVGIIASKLTLEGPIQKGKSSFIVSARRTYIDILARPFIKKAFELDGGSGVAGYYFYDMNAKVNHRFSDKDRLYLSFYSGKDKFYLRLSEKDTDPDGSEYEFNINTGLGWGNTTTALRWNHILNPKLFANTTLTYSKYKFLTEVGGGDKYRQGASEPWSENINQLKYSSGIDDVAAKIDFDYLPVPNHFIKFGASEIFHTFHPGVFDTRIISSEENIDITTKIGQPDLNASEIATYIEDDWKATDRIRINAGLHFSGFIPKKKSYFSIQPRFNIRYLLDKGWAVKGAFSTMRQYIHLLTNESIGLPTDLWLPTTDTIKPQDSWQVAVGLAKSFGKDKGYEISFEGYYKEMDGVIAFREGASLFQFGDWQQRVTQGTGSSYGTELFIQKKKGRFTGWLGYTLSWTWRQFDDLNFGKKYPYKYDHRHDLELVGSYKFTDRMRLSATWVYSTGNATTFGTSKYQAPSPYSGQNGYSYTYETTNTPVRNNFRFPSYNRMDIGIDFTKKKKHYERTWSYGAYNVYNRKNAFFLFLQTSDGKTNLKQASLFPIIPYINYSFKF
jgi:TonB-dependent Receptor Plug Domain/CarboxypepD_reg-like domain